MTKFFIALLVMVLAFPTIAALKVGKVDIQKVLVTVKQGKKVRSELKVAFEKKQKILKKDEKKIRKMQEDFQKQSLVMNDKAKAKKQSDLQKMIMDLQKKSMGYQKEIQGMEQKMKTPILKRVKSIVNQVSKTAGVEFTYEISTSPIVYAKDETDLTDRVIKLYNKKHPK